MSTDDTITAWGNHVDGAVALTKLRGINQFKDEMSHSIFRAVRTMMVRYAADVRDHAINKTRLQAVSNARNLSTTSPELMDGSVTVTSTMRMSPID
jgi:hypothetical protein